MEMISPVEQRFVTSNTVAQRFDAVSSGLNTRKLRAAAREWRQNEYHTCITELLQWVVRMKGAGRWQVKRRVRHERMPRCWEDVPRSRDQSPQLPVVKRTTT